MNKSADPNRLLYDAINFDLHHKETCERLVSFLRNSKQKYLLMCEPVGFGKTTFLLEEALKLRDKETGEFRRVIFLTYSFPKAVEIHGKLKAKIDGWKHKPKIVRHFGSDFIKEEQHYRNPRDIKECQKRKERKKAIDSENGSAWDVCKSCKYNVKCPYYRAQLEFREGPQTDILISTLAELQSAGFYLNKANKFEDADFVVLDEDGVRKTVISKEIERDQLEFFVHFIGCEKKKVLEDHKLSSEKRVLKINFMSDLSAKLDNIVKLYGSSEKLNNLSNELVYNPVDASISTNLHCWPPPSIESFSGPQGQETKNGQENRLNDRGLSLNEIRMDGYLSKLAMTPMGDQKKKINFLFRSWSKFLDTAFRTKSSLNFSLKKGRYGERLNLFSFPDLPFRKIVFTDATTVASEVNARFKVESDDLTSTYDPKVHGILVPKGQIFQVVENVPKTEYFNGDGDVDSKKLNHMMEKVVTLSEELGMRKQKTSVIAFRELMENRSFQQQCKKYGFLCDPTLYHGAVRGLNSIEENDLIVLGSNFPDDKSIKRNQFSEFDEEVRYKYSDFYLQWIQDENGSLGIDAKYDMKNLGVSGWATMVGKDRGQLGRKIYLENVIQSLRSRFYWYPTKTLVFCPYPLTDFGIAAHKLIFGVLKDANSQQIYTMLKMDHSFGHAFTLEEINKITSSSFESLEVVAKGFRNHKLTCCVDGNHLYLNSRELIRPGGRENITGLGKFKKA